MAIAMSGEEDYFCFMATRIDFTKRQMTRWLTVRRAHHFTPRNFKIRQIG